MLQQYFKGCMPMTCIQGKGNGGQMMIESKKENGKETVANTSPLDLYYKPDTNILVTSWINDLGYKQQCQESKELFYNSETLLSKCDLLEHFKKENRKKFADKNI